MDESDGMDRACATRKLDGGLIGALLRPALLDLLGRPYDARELEQRVWARMVCALDDPSSVYRAIEPGHIYAYPRKGPPQQYVAWQHGQWTWQDLPEGALMRLRISVA